MASCPFFLPTASSITSEQTGHVTGFLDPLEGLLEEADGRTDGVVDERRDEEPEPCPAMTEPMISSPFPELPWQKVGMDLFDWKKSHTL